MRPSNVEAISGFFGILLTFLMTPATFTIIPCFLLVCCIYLLCKRRNEEDDVDNERRESIIYDETDSISSEYSGS